ncbi:hypothetical protein ACO22_06860 [Paracoccidioides brasiliensis]|uniref:Uncharacterized protein n=1 Tax=Paracoccidioides brasiliensis TaxID=121759 RepID=A0A1D2J6B2_PARBR|nr:hypothetical protein ACO22_06860 [Paracoccidioides brasiliensis]
MRSISIIKYRVRNATIEDGYQSRAAQQIESPSIIFEPKLNSRRSGILFHRQGTSAPGQFISHLIRNLLEDASKLIRSSTAAFFNGK